MNLYIVEHHIGTYAMVNILLTQDYFSIVENYFNLEYETTHQMEEHLCLKETCDVSKENKYDSKEKMVI